MVIEIAGLLGRPFNIGEKGGEGAVFLQKMNTFLSQQAQNDFSPQRTNKLAIFYDTPEKKNKCVSTTFCHTRLSLYLQID